MGTMYDEGSTITRLYRVSTTAMPKVLEFTSTWRSGETGDSDMCTMVRPAVGTTMPDLEVECVSSHTAYPGEHGTDKDSSATRTETYRWKGSAYVKQSP
jgi:hypothetical protein